MSNQYRKDWAQSDAKEVLRQDLLSGRIDGWTWKKVYYESPNHEDYYRFYNPKNFSANLTRLRKKPSGVYRKASGWKKKDCKARINLRKDVISGRIEGWNWQQVYYEKIGTGGEKNCFLDFYRFYNPEDFKGFLETMRKQVKMGKQDSKIKKNAIDVYMDKQSINVGKLRWDGSAAQKKLRRMVKDREVKGRLPSDMWSSEPAFQQFTLKEFRDHLGHEKKRLRKIEKSDAYAERIRMLSANIRN